MTPELRGYPVVNLGPAPVPGRKLGQSALMVPWPEARFGTAGPYYNGSRWPWWTFVPPYAAMITPGGAFAMRAEGWW